MRTSRGSASLGFASIAGTYRRSTTCGSAIGRHTPSASIPSSSAIAETVLAPAVAVAPASPRTHAQEDALIEIARPVKAHWRACVWCVIVVAIGTGGLNADDN